MRNLWMLFVFSLATEFISEKVLVLSQLSSQSDDLYLEKLQPGDHPVDDEDVEDFVSGSGSGDYLFSDVTHGMSEGSSKDTPTQEWSWNTTAKQNPPPTTAGDVQDPENTLEDSTTLSYTLTRDKAEDIEELLVEPTADLFTDSTSPSSTAETYSMEDSPTDDTTEGLLTEDNRDDFIARDSTDGVLTKEGKGRVPAKDGRGSMLYEVDVHEQVTSENLWERTDVLAAVIACGVVGFLFAIFLLLLLVYRMKKKDEGSYELGVTKPPPTAYQKAPTKEFYA